MKTYIVVKEGVIIGGQPLDIGAEFQADAHSIPAYLRFGSVVEKEAEPPPKPTKPLTKAAADKAAAENGGNA